MNTTDVELDAIRVHDIETGHSAGQEPKRAAGIICIPFSI